MAAANIIPLNFPVLLDWRNWVFVFFVLFIAGALIHYLAPSVANPLPVA